ncbi:FkbM family methyltransferase [Phenylobacterium sp.]|uniref:FkbM family methyltransferase n=1 Tax=Phenylobacterium sp. TaxID=1871053 RepID=UPI0035C7C5AE
MPRADLGISLRNAIATTPDPSDRAAGRAEEMASASPPPRAKQPSLRGRLFGRLADYARRYLTASVEHRLTLIQDHLGGERAHVEHQFHLLQQQILGLSERQELVRAQLLRVEAQGEKLQSQVRALPGWIGPRLDEIEVKVRPLITFDETSYAVRLRDGYAMVPRDQPYFALSVANATSEGLEPGTRRVLQALAQPGGHVADVGANVGLLTLALAVAVGPDGRVFAFEPEAGPRAQLEKTLYLNGLKWVSVFDCAVGERSEDRVFHVSKIIGHSSLYALPETEELAEAVPVKVRPLDALVPPQVRLDVVKIDVEGAELAVLEGMSQVLERSPDIALVAEFGPSHLTRVGVSPEAWWAAFERRGFRAFAISEPDGACAPASLAQLMAQESVNLAFVRPGGGAEQRLPR